MTTGKVLRNYWEMYSVFYVFSKVLAIAMQPTDYFQERYQLWDISFSDTKEISYHLVLIKSDDFL